MKHEKTDDSGATAQPQPQRKVVRKRGGSSNDSDDEDGDARMRNHEVCVFRCEIFCQMRLLLISLRKPIKIER